MTEQPLLFGPESTLLGILTRPVGEAAPVACLIPNSGLIHRVGPHRFGVKLARSLAAGGMATLRLDLAGVGDSKAAAASTDYRAQASRDLRAAMDLIEREHGIRRFIVFGICSGAVNGYWAAVADPRIVGLLMYDGFWYRSRWTQLVRYWKRFRALSWGELSASLSRNLKMPGEAKAAESGGIFSSWDMANPSREEFIRSTQMLVDRGVSVFLLYGGTVLQFYSYAGQFRDTFKGEPFLDRVRCDFHPDIDHTVTTIAAQQKLISLAGEWARGVSASQGTPTH